MSKPLKDLHTIFLDTGIIIDLLKNDISKATPEIQKRIGLTKKFFECLNKEETGGKTRKVYQISAISIAEIFHVDNQHEDTLKAILSLVDSTQVEIYAFDESTALFHNKEFHSFLGNKSIAELKKNINYPTQGLANIEDRIRKDHLICATAKLYRSDLVLTNDPGFKAICDFYSIPTYCFTDSTSGLIMSNNEELIYGLT